MKRFATSSILVMLCISLLSCGFRLRGSIGLPEGLNSIYIKGVATYSPLSIELRKVLKNNKSIIVESEEDANVILIIQNVDFQRRVMSVDSQARAAEYQLVYEVEFTLYDNAENVLVPYQKIRIIRDYRFDPNNVLAKEREEEQIKTEMVQFAVRQMIRRIDSNLKAKQKQQSGTPS